MTKALQKVKNACCTSCKAAFCAAAQAAFAPAFHAWSGNVVFCNTHCGGMARAKSGCECKVCLVHQTTFAPLPWTNCWNQILKLYSAFKMPSSKPAGKFQTLTMICKNLKDPDNTFLSSIVYTATGKLMQRIFLPRHKKVTWTICCRNQLYIIIWFIENHGILSTQLMHQFPLGVAVTGGCHDRLLGLTAWLVEIERARHTKILDKNMHSFWAHAKLYMSLNTSKMTAWWYSIIGSIGSSFHLLMIHLPWILPKFASLHAGNQSVGSAVCRCLRSIMFCILIIIMSQYHNIVYQISYII